MRLARIVVGSAVLAGAFLVAVLVVFFSGVLIVGTLAVTAAGAWLFDCVVEAVNAFKGGGHDV